MKNNLRRGSGVELLSDIFLIGVSNFRLAGRLTTVDCGEGEKEGLQKGGIFGGISADFRM